MSFSVRGPGPSFAGLRASSASFERGVARLSSGLRIRTAADDAAGLAISERMRARSTGSAMATRNVHDGINLLQTAEGGMASITALLHRARELAVQAASRGTSTQSDRTAAATEVAQLVDEIDRVAGTTSFNGQRLLDGSRPRGFLFQVGADGGDTLVGSGHDLRASTLGLQGFTTVLAGTTSTTPTTYTTTSAAFGVVDADTNAERRFFVTVDGVRSPELSVKRKIYQLSEHALLRDQFSAQLATYGVSVTLTGEGTTSARLQFTSTAGSEVRLEFDGALASALGITTTSTPGTSTSTPSTSSTSAGVAALVAAGSDTALDVLDGALTAVLGQRTRNGALQNRLEHRLGVLAAVELDTAAARSRLVDADVALEWSKVVRAQVLVQAGTALAAQAPSGGQRVVQLLSAL